VCVYILGIHALLRQVVNAELIETVVIDFERFKQRFNSLHFLKYYCTLSFISIVKRSSDITTPKPFGFVNHEASSVIR